VCNLLPTPAASGGVHLCEYHDTAGSGRRRCGPRFVWGLPWPNAGRLKRRQAEGRRSRLCCDYPFEVGTFLPFSSISKRYQGANSRSPVPPGPGRGPVRKCLSSISLSNRYQGGIVGRLRARTSAGFTKAGALEGADHTGHRGGLLVDLVD